MAHIGPKRIVVLGGGIAGLSFVHYLRNFTLALGKVNQIEKVTVIEANDYLGGCIKSRIFEDGVVHELGPRGVRVQGVRAMNTIVLLEQLGLGDKVVKVKLNSAAGKYRHIYQDGKLYRIPVSIGALFSRFPGDKSFIVSALLRDMFRAKKMDLTKYEFEDPSIYEFVKHRFGEDAAETMADPVMRGITAGDVRKLSTKSLLRELIDKEQAYGAVIGNSGRPVTAHPHDELLPHDLETSKLLTQFQKERVQSYNLLTGLQTLPERLSNSLLNTNKDDMVSIYNQTTVKSVKFGIGSDEGASAEVALQTLDGDLINMEADHVVAAMPSNQFHKLLPDELTKEQKEALEFTGQIPHVPVATCCLEYRVEDTSNWPKSLNSFGFLTNSKAGSKLLGVAFDSSMFPDIDRHTGSIRMTCMMGGEWFADVFGTDNPDQVSDAKVEETALEGVREVLGIREDPYRTTNLIWRPGIAQYRPGHRMRLDKMRSLVAKSRMPLTLLGQSYDGVAVNDVLFSSRIAAYNFVKSL